jgi:hypothetical protein
MLAFLAHGTCLTCETGAEVPVFEGTGQLHPARIKADSIAKRNNFFILIVQFLKFGCKNMNCFVSRIGKLLNCEVLFNTGINLFLQKRKTCIKHIKPL